MAFKDYFPENEFKALGLSPVAINVLRRIATVADALDRLGLAETNVANLDEDLEQAALSLLTLDARTDDLEDFADDADDRYVRQDIGAAWAAPSGTASRATFATYAGQTISNPPTQAEVQAIDDHVKLISQRVKGIVDDLLTNHALTP